MEALCGMNDDCHRHFRQTVRIILVKLLRKYGMETLSSMISNTMLQKRLKNINKIEEAKKKNKQAKKLQDDEKGDDEFNAKRRPKR